MAKCMQGTGTYLSSWKIRKVGEALQFVQALVNNKDRSGMSKHTMLTQTQTGTAIVLDQVSAMQPHHSLYLL